MADVNNSRVLVIGLDGGTIDLIGPLLKEGKMPNLSKMQSAGSYTKLYSTIPPLSPPAWTTFSTGKAPEKHGIFDFSKRKKGTYDFIPTSSVDSKEETLWDLIGSRGGKSIVVNVPLTYPPTKINGVMVSGFPTPPRRRDYTYPSDLLPKLERKFGEVRIHKPQVMYRKGRERELTEEMMRITEQQTEITKFLMNEIPWQLAVSVYDATDVLGHYFWAYLDPNHPKFDAKISERVKQLVTDIHVSLDHAIGELVEAAGERSLKFVISDHGFGPVYYGVYVNNWLLDEGYMRFKNDPKVRMKYYAYRHGLHLYNLLQLSKKLHLVKSIESAYSTKSILLKALKMISLSFDDVDWGRTTVYAAGNLGQLYINLEGREPHGIVSPKDTRKLELEVAAKLRNLKDPDTGSRMFDHIYTKEELFQGPATTDAPDVIFLDGQMIYAAHRFFELGSNKLITLHPVYSGHHKMDGIMFLTGIDVKQVQSTAQRQASIVDLAPTILRFLGIPIPKGMDGRTLDDLFVVDSDYFRGVRIPEVTGVLERERIEQASKELGHDEQAL